MYLILCSSEETDSESPVARIHNRGQSALPVAPPSTLLHSLPCPMQVDQVGARRKIAPDLTCEFVNHFNGNATLTE